MYQRSFGAGTTTPFDALVFRVIMGASSRSGARRVGFIGRALSRHPSTSTGREALYSGALLLPAVVSIEGESLTHEAETVALLERMPPVPTGRGMLV
jgi:hypothetical protein